MTTQSTKLKNIIIGKSLQAKRESLELTRSQIAQFLEVQPQFVANWERGQCLPPKKVLPVLLEVLKMSKKDVVNLYTMATRVSLEEYFDSING